jgi:DUF4097 and DUF4098 domain-containing protein YvlB
MSQETIKILKMLEEGKISSREADSLLSALGGKRHHHAFKDLNIDHEHLHEEMDALRDNIHQINPSKIVAEAMYGVKEGLKGLKCLKDLDGLKNIHIELDDIRGTDKAEDTKEITIPSSGINSIAVNQPRSDIEITGTDGDRIVIRADIQVWADDKGEAEEKLKSLDISTENDSGTLRIKVDGPPWTKKRRAKVDFQIEMPHSIMAEIASASGDVNINGLHKGTKLNTASGDITVSDCKGELIISSASGGIDINTCHEIDAKINTASGDLDISGTDGDIVFQTVSGDVTASVSGSLQGQTVSGDMELISQKIGSLKLRTTSGDISLASPMEEGTGASIATVSGDVAIVIKGEASVSVECGTVSGDIDCERSMSDLHRSGRSLSGRIGEGRGKLSVKTVSGDIDII